MNRYTSLREIENGFKFEVSPFLSKTSVNFSNNELLLLDVYTPKNQGYFYQVAHQKKRIVLHFTAGNTRSDIYSLTQDDYHVSAPFVISRDGTIYNLFNSKYWSGHLGAGLGNIGTKNAQDKVTIGIEISNYGYLFEREGNLETIYSRVYDPKTKKTNPIDVYCSLDQKEAYCKLEIPFRGQLYFATYTPEQLESLILLLRFLTAKYDIPRNFLPPELRFSTTDEILDFSGIVSHVNYRKSGKWDIGPSFDWESIIAGVQSANFIPKKKLSQDTFKMTKGEDEFVDTQLKSISFINEPMEDITESRNYNPFDFEAPTLFASIIGINAYEGINNSLQGCVTDALNMDSFLRDLIGQQQNLQYKPKYFLAPLEGDDSIAVYMEKVGESNDKVLVPTFDNVKNFAFEHLKQAKDGDICVLIYSGHGSTTEAPKEFSFNNPGLQNETIVLQDSRSKARDLIDKELAFLLWDALNGKNVNCLVIMDSCHSGNNTKSMIESKIRYKQTSSDRNKIAFTDYIGYDKGYYTIKKEGYATFPEAEYVHLAAAQSHEKAADGSALNGSVFTSNLVKVLRAGGSSKSYLDLQFELKVNIRILNPGQTPVFVANPAKDINKQFLGSQIIPYRPTFEIRYDFYETQWVLFGGRVHGLENGTTIKVIGLDNVHKLQDVNDYQSKLGKLDQLDPTKTYQAIVLEIPNPGITIGLLDSIKGNKDLIDSLIEESNRRSPKYYLFNINENTDSQFLIHFTPEKEFVLTRTENLVPVFRRTNDIDIFWEMINSLGCWFKLLGLKETGDSIFSKDDFIFEAEKIKGDLTYNNLDTVQGNGFQSISAGAELTIPYEGHGKHALRFRIKINPKSSLQTCHVAALYLDSEYGINSGYIREDNNFLRNNGESLQLTYAAKNDNGELIRLYPTIPLFFDDKYSQLGIHEIIDHIMIVVSTQPLSFQWADQPSLPLDSQLLKMKAAGMLKDSKISNFAVFDFKIRFIRGGKEKTIVRGNNLLGPVSMFVVGSINGTVSAVTNEDFFEDTSSLALPGQSSTPSSKNITYNSSSIWGEEILTDNNPFESSFDVNNDNKIVAIELMGEQLSLGEDDAIIIVPEKANSLKSVDDFEDVTVSYGFDSDAGLFMPVGVSNSQGQIRIERLPNPTPMKLNAKDKSLGGSIKLFFKKIFHPKQIDTFIIYKLMNDSGDWKKMGEGEEEIKSVLDSAQSTANILLLVHGIIGDTKAMVEGFRLLGKSFSKNVDFVITYDYENLASPISEIAERLKNSLKSMGLGVSSEAKITIVAHSMGGLISRWMLEKNSGIQFVSKLIMVGTPNSGSELAHLGTSALGLLTHALNATGPIKYFITGLSILLKRLKMNPTATLEELEPGSHLIQELMNSPKPQNVVYEFLGGDINQYTSAISENDPFIQKLLDHIKNGIVYPSINQFLYDKNPNDIAVTHDSMKSVLTDTDKNLVTLACDHITYFSNDKGLQEIVNIIKR